jgi:hypothetical protein
VGNLLCRGCAEAIQRLCKGGCVLKGAVHWLCTGGAVFKEAVPNEAVLDMSKSLLVCRGTGILKLRQDSSANHCSVVQPTSCSEGTSS